MENKEIRYNKIRKTVDRDLQQEEVLPKSAGCLIGARHDQKKNCGSWPATIRRRSAFQVCRLLLAQDMIRRKTIDCDLQQEVLPKSAGFSWRKT
jgi:hypothetical protein